MQLKDISIERLEQIEQERNQTIVDPNFQQWMQPLGVSSSYNEPSGILNARHMMSLWDPDRYERETLS